MAEYALVIDGEFREVRNYAERPPHIPHKAVQWFPVERETAEPVGTFIEAEQDRVRIAIAPHPPPPPPPPPPIPSISDRQFIHELRERGVVTQAQALAFVGQGILPPPLAVIIAAIPDASQREDAELLVTGAVTFERLHTMTDVIGAAFGWTAEQIDEFFREAATR